MPEPERDPLQALGAAWAKVAPPAAERELAELDAGTRRAVERLRRAWESLEAPASVGATPLRRAAPAPRSFVPAAAAALLIALLGAAAWLGWSAAPAPPHGPPVARGGPTPPQVTRGGGLPPPGELPFGAAAGVVAVTSDRIEMRAGNVRLVLLTGGAPGADLDSDTERTH